MAKQLYYFCVQCSNAWNDDYSPEYGECDDECSSCGKDFSPYTKKNEWLKNIKEHEKRKSKVEKAKMAINSLNDRTKINKNLKNLFEKWNKEDNEQ